MTETILLEKRDTGVAILTFNRPQALNAMSLEAMSAFAAIVERLRNDPNLRVLILTGAGEKAFCSGGDLVELSQHPSMDEGRDFITIMGNALLALERLPVPVIAAINGYALGGGSEIAVACDIRFVDEAVKMGFVQINMGLVPGWGAGQRLLRLVGYAKAMELLLKGSVLRAEDVLGLGLANEVVGASKALDAALQFAGEIAKQPVDTVRGIKALLQAGLNQPYEQALQTERDLFPALWAAEPHKKAVEAFLERQRTRHQLSEQKKQP